jgi:hypothetical protein
VGHGLPPDVPLCPVDTDVHAFLPPEFTTVSSRTDG